MFFRGITEYQQRLILKLARQRGATNPSLTNLVVAREDLRRLTVQLAVSKKMRSRKKAEQIGTLPQLLWAPETDHESSFSTKSALTPAGATSPAVTELEWEIEQLENSIDDEDVETWGKLCLA